MSEDMRDEELKKDEALKADQENGAGEQSAAKPEAVLSGTDSAAADGTGGDAGIERDLEADEGVRAGDDGEPADHADDGENGGAGPVNGREDQAPEDSCSGGREEKKSFFKKKKDPRDEKIEELTDRVKRQMAEFENFRKRSEKEKSSMYEMGARDIIERILPVIDNFERGLATVPEEAKGTPLAEGMEKIYKQFQKTLEDAGVNVIEAVGREFDPNFHNAVMHVDDDSLGENIVADELQKGYMYRDTVVRHSMVKVAN